MVRLSWGFRRSVSLLVSFGLVATALVAARSVFGDVASAQDGELSPLGVEGVGMLEDPPGPDSGGV